MAKVARDRVRIGFGQNLDMSQKMDGVMAVGFPVIQHVNVGWIRIYQMMFFAVLILFNSVGDQPRVQ